MIVVFDGFEHDFLITEDSPLVVEIESVRLFARVCQSLLFEQGGDAVEPYSLWEGDAEIKPAGAFTILLDPIRLPWGDAKLLAAIYAKLESYCWENEDMRNAIEKLDSLLKAKCVEVGFQMHADYRFEVEWDIRRYLKTFGFSPDCDENALLIDNVLRFISLVADAAPGKPFLLVNFKTFFSKSEVESLYERAFFLRIPLLLLENKRETVQYGNERKLCIDQDLLEF